MSYKREHYLKHKESHKRSWERRQKRNYDYAIGYKLENGCSVCGYNRCSMSLDFHHVGNDKEGNVSRLCTQGSSLERVKREIEKCVVLCRNCHGELHAGLIDLG